jgi:hypothetical protein
MFILIGRHVRHFSDRNQTVSNVKKINHGLQLSQNNVNGSVLLHCSNFYSAKLSLNLTFGFDQILYFF